MNLTIILMIVLCVFSVGWVTTIIWALLLSRALKIVRNDKEDIRKKSEENIQKMSKALNTVKKLYEVYSFDPLSLRRILSWYNFLSPVMYSQGDHELSLHINKIIQHSEITGILDNRDKVNPEDIPIEDIKMLSVYQPYPDNNKVYTNETVVAPDIISTEGSNEEER